jgi:signal transduction histidine kinase
MNKNESQIPPSEPYTFFRENYGPGAVPLTPKQKNLLKQSSGLLWTSIVLLYFLISFIWYRWDYTWILFPIGAVLQNVLSGLIRKDLKLTSPGILYTTTLVVYLILSIATNAWHITWLIFLLAIAIQQAIRLIQVWRETE